jgi:hypothetical protein
MPSGGGPPATISSGSISGARPDGAEVAGPGRASRRAMATMSTTAIATATIPTMATAVATALATPRLVQRFMIHDTPRTLRIRSESSISSS